MRDFLEEADRHREDGLGRAQPLRKAELPKRFYTEVGVGSAQGGFAVTLDGKSPRTPTQKPVIVPQQALAEAMAAEWAAQEAVIDPATMPVTRLINTAIEAGEETVPALRAEIVKYAGTDLLLYRADTPRELVAAQEAAWDPVLVALARHFGVGFQPTIGIMHQAQPEPTLRRLEAAVVDTGLIEIVALVSLTGITGSGLLTVALREKLIDAEGMWAAAHVDEDHNVRMWGEIEEITERRAKRRRDFDAAIRVLDLL